MPEKPRDRFIASLERRLDRGQIPHFELCYFLTMEKFGKVHPLHRDYEQWGQMSETERDLHREEMADIYIAVAEHFDHSAILLIGMPLWDLEEQRRQVELVRKKTGDRYFLMIHGDATFAIPDGNGVYDFSMRMMDDPQGVKDEAARELEKRLKEQAVHAADGGLDGLALCSDYCFNAGPFLNPTQFDEFVYPYLKQQIAAQREMGYYVIKHTDGNIMPILDRLLDCQPHALHSLDPQGGVDIAEVRKQCGDKVCLIGNVNCGLMDTGTEEEALASARYAMLHGSAGKGYIFSTSNCVYTGMKPERYELVHDLWKKEGTFEYQAELREAAGTSS